MTKSTDWREGKPYRPNVGICLINRDGLIWFGKTESSGPEIVTSDGCWQMPQGGVEASEDIVEAARRELWEETKAKSVELLEITDEWWAYDFPDNYNQTGHKLDMYCGQKQKWVAFRFTGSDSEFDISAEHSDEPQEFFDWEWYTPEIGLARSPAFKRMQYKRVFSVFYRYFQAL